MDSSLDRYAAAVEGLDGLGSHLVEVLRDLLSTEAVPVQDVPKRVKSQSSADKKILASPAKYQDYSDLNDLLGIRVITLFENDLLKAEKVIRQVLAVPDEMVSDKVDRYQANEFGYRSKHFIGPMSDVRLSLPENHKYRNRVVEVQLRSSLQHTWAEIEHDLGYKPQRSVTFALRRRFSQLAALMELADESFSELRSQLEDVEARTAGAGSSREGSEATRLTLVELVAFIRDSPDLHLLDSKIATIYRRAVLPEGSTSRTFTAYLLDICLQAGWLRVDDVSNAVKETLAKFDYEAVRSVLTPQLTSALGVEDVGLRPGFSLIAAWKLTQTNDAKDGNDNLD